MPVARFMWTFTVRFRDRVRVRVRVRCSFTVFSCGQRVDTSLRLEPHLTRFRPLRDSYVYATGKYSRKPVEDVVKFNLK